MNKFLKTTYLFSINLLCILIILPVVEIFLPLSIFTYRSWEALIFNNSKYSKCGPFYPNATTTMKEEGDLGHHTKKALIKSVIWKTDCIGYRNNDFISDPDIILIGDSFFAGSSLSQDETISFRLSKLSADKVYNMSPANMPAFDKLLNKGVIKKPKTIIYSIVERNMPPAVFTPFVKEVNLSLFFELAHHIDANVILDRAFRLYSIEWAKARFNNIHGMGVASEINPDMMFLPSRKNNIDSNIRLKSTYDALASYKKYCDSLEINFIFVPMPDKRTVYYDLVPLEKQPNYLNKLDSLLKTNNIHSINTLEIYNNCRQTSDKLLYHLDDTHWNKVATELIAESLCVKLKNVNFEN